MPVSAGGLSPCELKYVFIRHHFPHTWQAIDRGPHYVSFQPNDESLVAELTDE